MRLLLDTHIFLWYVAADHRLATTLRDKIQDPANEVFLSVASVWETVVKYHLGKLPLPQAPDYFVPAQRIAHGISPLLIDEGSMPHLGSLPLLHRDPFDRMLVSQALQHNMVIATVDAKVVQYGVPTISA